MASDDTIKPEQTNRQIKLPRVISKDIDNDASTSSSVEDSNILHKASTSVVEDTEDYLYKWKFNSWSECSITCGGKGRLY